MGVCLLSKLSQLKQDAYQAGKKKDWDQAVSIYEKILELEKSNPATINEMGDLCLKAGEQSRAVNHFLKAAAKYRKTGLLNNAVAIYKKILRHDDGNINAHWYLAKTRASQGLLHDGEAHALHFLKSSEEVSGELKEIFLKRCVELFELYSECKGVLEHLLQVFRTWDMQLEASRLLCLIACLQFDEGHEEQARQGLADVLDRTPEVANYPEYTKWNNRINPVSNSSDTFNEFGSVSLDGPEQESTDTPPTEDIAAAVSDSVDPFMDSGSPEVAPVSEAVDETSFGDLSLDLDASEESGAPEVPNGFEIPAVPETPIEADESAPAESAPAFEIPEVAIPEVEIPEVEIPEEPAAEIPDDEGCFSLDLDDGASFDDLIAEAAGDSAPVSEEPNPAQAPPAADHSGSGEVDLLAEILADDSGDNGPGDADQLETITKEIGAQVGGDDQEEDADRLYEMGLVYLEMGLLDQACDSLAKAADDPAYAMRAYEMWGVALSRANKPDEAVKTLTEGLTKAAEGSHEYLGLLYHIARAHEQAERPQQAVEFYEKIQAQDRAFLDVGKRLASLSTV